MVFEFPGKQLDLTQMTDLYQSLFDKLQQSFQQQTEHTHHGLDSFIWVQSGILSSLYQQLLSKLLEDPFKTMQFQMAFWQDWNLLNQKYLLINFLSPGAKLDSSLKEKDKRFAHAIWEQNPWFTYLAESYLLIKKHISTLVTAVVDPKVHKQTLFFINQTLDALSPTNFMLTNPEILTKASETNGQNLVQGFENLMRDIRQGGGRLRISMTDEQAFSVGKNIAITPGKIVFENDLIQLIQYSPTTDKVYERPLLIIPPWINKYYILDLQPHNSYAKWIVDQGYTVFMISWVNPNKHHAKKDFQDYMLEGSLAAIHHIKKITGQERINALGFCIGGTLLACTLAYLAYKKQHLIESATYLTTLLDFSEPGDLGVFINEEQLQSLEEEMKKDGYLDGNILMLVFNLLRPNDLIWQYYIKNYFLGEKPRPIDLLYWNSDSTNLPPKMAKTYLRGMYLYNHLKEANRLIFDGVPLNLGLIKTPSYFLATENDHIAPWRSVYAGLGLMKAPVTFVLGGSGHIAGVVNPPANNKYGYYTAETLTLDPNQWYQETTKHSGSWWVHWEAWLRKHSGQKITVKKSPTKTHKSETIAPGNYVKVRLVDVKLNEK